MNAPWLPRYRLVFVLVTAFNVLLLCSVGHYLWSPGGSRVTLPSAPPENARGAVGAGRWERATPVGYRIRTTGCTLPQFDPFDPSVRRYFRPRSRGRACSGRPNFLTVRCSSVSPVSTIRSAHTPTRTHTLAYNSTSNVTSTSISSIEVDFIFSARTAGLAFRPPGLFEKDRSPVEMLE